jgi:hypothetical protein
MNQLIYLSTIRNPLDQFEIRDYIMLDVFVFGNYHISLTNMVEYLLKAFILIIAIHFIINK